MTNTIITPTFFPFHNSPCSNTVVIPLISFVLTLCSFLLQGHLDLTLADEGFLWYGSVSTLHGQIPLLDFQAYDPGRYYWVAAWFKMLGNSLMSMRISLAVFQFLGLTCGLFAVSRIIKSRFLLIIVGIVLLLWIHPRHKIFEHSITMGAVYVGMLLIESPTVRRHLLAGVFIGIAAFFGRNHGLYLFLSFSMIVAYISCCTDKNDNLLRKISVFCVGVVVGYLPMILMLVSVDGFSNAFYESIRFLIEIGGTNIPKPVPWPWNINFSGQSSMLVLIHQFIVGSLFLIAPVFYLLSPFRIFTLGKERIRESALFISSCCIGIMYMHHAFARADINHLAQSIHPLLLAMIAFPVGNYNQPQILRKLFVIFLLLVSLLSVGIVSHYYRFISRSASYTSIIVDGNKYMVNKHTAGIISAVKSINDKLVKPDEQLLIAPHWPTLYPILKRKSPVWELYFLFPISLVLQKKMIKQLQTENTNWIILGDVPLDGRDELRFRNINSLMWEYINRNYSEYQQSELPRSHKLLRKKQTE